MPEQIYSFAWLLRRLLDAREPEAFEALWESLTPEPVGWEALGLARRRSDGAWESAVDEVDGLLLRLLDRVPVMTGDATLAGHRIRTFRLPALERLQHAAAAALVAQRYGVAGLRTVVADEQAPIGRRYFAFLALGERHPRGEWPLFARYLTPGAHHAFVGAAAEAARFYPESDAARKLISLFQAVRADLHLRAFLSPRILESLFVIGDARTLPFFRELLTAGHTAADPERCEVIRALVMIRRMTGRLEPNSKYPDLGDPGIADALTEAESLFERRRDLLNPVTVI